MTKRKPNHRKSPVRARALSTASLKKLAKAAGYSPGTVHGHYDTVWDPARANAFFKLFPPGN
jgi:hypothetical protein